MLFQILFNQLKVDCTNSEQECSQESTYFYEFNFFLAHVAFV